MGKRKYVAAVAAMGMLVLILDSRTALSGGAQGVDLCLRTVIPSLFPFLFLSGCFSAAFAGTKLTGLHALGELFFLPPGSEYLMIPAFLGGYPIGAQSVAQAYDAGYIQRAKAERLLAYCSNVGPAFLFGMTANQFGQKYFTWESWAIQIFSAWTAARLFGCREDSPGPARQSNGQPTFGIESTLWAMLKICGWILLFRIVASFLERWFLWAAAPWIRVSVIGLLELANGCCCLNQIVDEGLRFVICNALLAFGGLCVAYQTASVCGELNLRYYFAGKLLQGAVALVLAVGVYYRLWYLFPIWFAFSLLIPKALKKTVEIPHGVVYNR